jgi:hypothetical protein
MDESSSGIGWRKSSFSGTNCVEMAPTSAGVAVRNSRRPDAGTLTCSKQVLGGWLSAAKAGELDDLI